MGVTAQQLYPSPLRYPGGKGQLSNFIKLLMLENGLIGAEYVEPYAGGASVALTLLYEEYASHVHINDLNPGVAALWRSALGAPADLCRRIAECEVSVDEWRRQRRIQQEREPSDLDLGFSTLFLNRTSRSGIIGAGMIGGWAQSGRWKIDARFNREDLIRRVRRISRFRSRITVTQLDAVELLKGSLPKDSKLFIYLDPPYFAKGQELYQNSYGPEDHCEVARLVDELGQPWIVSYDAAPEIESLYASWPSLRYGLHYSAQARYEGTEAMFFSRGLRVPEVESPAHVPATFVDQVRLAA